MKKLSHYLLILSLIGLFNSCTKEGLNGEIEQPIVVWDKNYNAVPFAELYVAFGAQNKLNDLGQYDLKRITDGGGGARIDGLSRGEYIFYAEGNSDDQPVSGFIYVRYDKKDQENQNHLYIQLLPNQ